MAFLIYIYFSIPLIQLHITWKLHGWFPISCKWIEYLICTFIKWILLLFREGIIIIAVWILLKTVGNWWRVLLFFAKNISINHWVLFRSFKRILNLRSFKRILDFRNFKGILDISLIKSIRFGFSQWLEWIEHIIFVILNTKGIIWTWITIIYPIIIIIKNTIWRVILFRLITKCRRWWLIVLEEWWGYFIGWFGGRREGTRLLMGWWKGWLLVIAVVLFIIVIVCKQFWRLRLR